MPCLIVVTVLDTHLLAAFRVGLILRMIFTVETVFCVLACCKVAHLFLWQAGSSDEGALWHGEVSRGTQDAMQTAI